MDTGLLVLRVLIGGLLVAHGAQKAFGAFGGLGPAATAPLFDQWGLRPGRRLVLVAAALELVGGTLLAAGLVTPLATAMVIGTLTVAASVNWGNGLWAVKGGYELAFVYALAAVTLALTGPGNYSLDHLFGLQENVTRNSSVPALLLGFLSAACVIVYAQRSKSSSRGRAMTERSTS